MNTDGHGQGRRRRGRGRPRGSRNIEFPYKCNRFVPDETFEPDDEPVILYYDELEALRLVDLNDLDQEQAAASLGISRRTLWTDLHRARKKVADAIVNGKTISIVFEK
ncbi:DUF134 domain-containing protein [Methanoplanus sp. FWC-SCC4]|uniref:UPF0251 protein F1737_08545 n=1 Tax=Methanochimaera problematica TaxID=2609417 RepID=A0AA97FD31_9EURY|nr:DUF134 domain-containing protein [Methanoplanus sp. FWC-SCC4]WOF16734.1 DUF134 domain-containing protein [Methanoplanus sp. FWC-SCC4]